MGTLNPSARRAAWQRFKRKHARLEKMPRYPKGLGPALDALVSMSGRTKRCCDDYNKALIQYRKLGNSSGLISFLRADSFKSASEKYAKALVDTRWECWDTARLLKGLDKFIAEALDAADDPALDRDWRVHSVPLARDLDQHIKHIDAVKTQANAIWTEVTEWNHRFDRATLTKMQKVKFVLTYPIKKAQDEKIFKEIMEAVKDPPRVEDVVYKF